MCLLKKAINDAIITHCWHIGYIHLKYPVEVTCTYYKTSVCFCDNAWRILKNVIDRPYLKFIFIFSFWDQWLPATHLLVIASALIIFYILVLL